MSSKNEWMVGCWVYENCNELWHLHGTYATQAEAEAVAERCRKGFDRKHRKNVRVYPTANLDLYRSQRKYLGNV